MSIPVFAANAHDSGYDLVPGNDITNTRIGVIYWGHQAGNEGLVVRLDADETNAIGEDYPADDITDAARYLASRGYELDADSQQAVAGLGDA